MNVEYSVSKIIKIICHSECDYFQWERISFSLKFLAGSRVGADQFNQSRIELIQSWFSAFMRGFIWVCSHPSWSLKYLSEPNFFGRTWTKCLSSLPIKLAKASFSFLAFWLKFKNQHLLMKVPSINLPSLHSSFLLWSWHL